MSRTRSILAAASVATTVLFLGMPAASAATAPAGSGQAMATWSNCDHNNDRNNDRDNNRDNNQNGMEHGQDSSRQNDCDNHGRHPHGDPHTGLGGSVTSGNAAETVAGAGLVALAGAGFVARRRRSTV